MAFLSLLALLALLSSPDGLSMYEFDLAVREEHHFKRAIIWGVFGSMQSVTLDVVVSRSGTFLTRLPQWVPVVSVGISIFQFLGGVVITCRIVDPGFHHYSMSISLFLIFALWIIDSLRREKRSETAMPERGHHIVNTDPELLDRKTESYAEQI